MTTEISELQSRIATLEAELVRERELYAMLKCSSIAKIEQAANYAAYVYKNRMHHELNKLNRCFTCNNPLDNDDSVQMGIEMIEKCHELLDTMIYIK